MFVIKYQCCHGLSGPKFIVTHLAFDPSRNHSAAAGHDEVLKQFIENQTMKGCSILWGEERQTEAACVLLRELHEQRRSDQDLCHL
jgi:hypothetical protein